MLALAAIGVAAPAAAGGWAVVSLDSMGVGVPEPGQPFEVGFMIRQHGRTPITDPDAAVLVTDATGHDTRFPARPLGAVGHHVATVTIPAAGTYHWSVEHMFGIQDVGMITVGGSPSTASGGGGSTSPWTAPLFAVAVLLGALGVVDLVRSTRHRPQPA